MKVTTTKWKTEFKEFSDHQLLLKKILTEFPKSSHQENSEADVGKEKTEELCGTDNENIGHGNATADDVMGIEFFWAIELDYSWILYSRYRRTGRELFFPYNRALSHHLLII